MRRVGFTGTQQGMTPMQKAEVEEWLRDLRSAGPDEFHHGDCIGADAEAYKIAQTLGYRIVQHPPNINSKRAFTSADQVMPAKPYLDRNHDIVDACETLIAAPKGTSEELRSGTWATVRYARKQRKQVIMAYPDMMPLVEAHRA